MATATDTIDLLTSPQRRRRSSFHLVLALVMTAVVLIGFGYDAPDFIIHPKVSRPAIMWVHGVTMLAWIAVYIAQTALVRANNVRAHRWLGQLALVLAVAMVPLMLAAAVVMDRFDLFHFPLPNRDSQIAYLAVQLWGALCFTILIGLGAALRKRPEYHRRLMFLATCGLLDAGFGRFPMPWGPAGNQLAEQWAYLALDAVILVAMLRDWRSLGRVHRVFRMALPAILLGQASALYLFIVHPQWWTKTATTLLA